MKIDVRQLKKNQGAAFPFEGELDLPKEMFGGDVPFRQVTFRGKARAEGEFVYTSGQAGVFLKSSCDRCGKPVDYEVTAELTDRFARQDSADVSDEDFTYREDGIDLSEYVKDKIVLALPVRRLCDPNCKGLCPICGQDLNLGSCKCDRMTGKKEEKVNPFSVLKNLNQEN